MAYPLLRQKIEILHKRYRLDPAQIAIEIKMDKTTAWRWLFQRADNLDGTSQDRLVAAINQTLRKENLSLSAQSFRNPNIVEFCADAGLSKIEAAIFSGYALPVPEILIDGLFDGTSNASRCRGEYLLFRHDKETAHNQPPYLQACVTIENDADHRTIYRDIWGNNDDRTSYEGYVFTVGTIINVVGQRAGAYSARPEVWWCGLRIGGVDATGSPTLMQGYVSNITYRGALYTDRVILVRSNAAEFTRVREVNEYFVDRARIQAVAGEAPAAYIDAWKDVPI